MIENLGERQQDVLRLLLQRKTGMTVDELSRTLQITRNAVRQHLAVMGRDGLVAQSATRPTGGRPEQLYVLGAKGIELFPRHYSWFSQLLIESMIEEAGREALANRLAGLGRRVAEQLRVQSPVPEDPARRVAPLAQLMTGLGYHARAVEAGPGLPVIEADNCVFHHLAARYPEVCRFDLALLSAYVGAEVEHRECMVRGGQCCRFGFRADEY
jgi:predicted ArsR family transcriptional regulator